MIDFDEIEIGDKFEVIESDNKYGHQLQIGSVAEVVEIFGKNDIYVRGTLNSGQFGEQNVSPKDLCYIIKGSNGSYKEMQSVQEVTYSFNLRVLNRSTGEQSCLEYSNVTRADFNRILQQTILP